MTKMIDCSIDGAGITVKSGMRRGVYLILRHGFRGKETYTADQITELAEVDADRYRSGAGALAGAVVGGVLTGGIGAVVGLVAGGRRRSEISYFLRFSDGNHAAFTVKGLDAKLMHELHQKLAMQRRAAGSE